MSEREKDVIILTHPPSYSPLPKGKGGDVQCKSSSLWEGEDIGGGGDTLNFISQICLNFMQK